MTSVVFEVTGIHCSSCGILIDDAVEDLPGVARSRTNTRNGRTRVDFDPSLTSATDIVTAISGAGYPAQVAAG
jgi:copper chaperone